MSMASLFSGVNFSSTIKKYCATQGWKIADLNSERAILRFAMESGRDQTLFIIRYESTLEFSVPSMAAFESEENMPHFLSTLLMKRSSEKKIGFWCIERIGDKSVYSYMHNAEMQLIDSDYFAKVVRALITECDDFEGVLIQLLSK
jgi:hypothetical protein